MPVFGERTLYRRSSRLITSDNRGMLMKEREPILSVQCRLASITNIVHAYG